MFKRALLAAVAAVPFLFHPSQSDAQLATECVNCATIWTQLQATATQAKQLATQAEQYVVQLQSYANQIQNSVALPMQIYAQVQGDIMQVRSIANAASLLTGNAGTMMSRLQNAQGYVASAEMLPQQMGNQFTLWQTAYGNAANSLGRTLGVQQGQEQNAAALQFAIQSHASTAVGQMQVAQAGVEMAGLTNYQLQQLSTTLTAAAQEQATKDMIAADQQRMQQAAMLRFSQYQQVSTTGSQGF